MLWCYVDLFNTFQYYVLLSDNWDKNIVVCESYIQLLQKIDRSIPELYIRKPKHILIYAMFYNIEPCLDLDEFKKRVEEAIKKESPKKSLSDVISPKMNAGYISAEKLKGLPRDELIEYLKPFNLYSDEDDRIREDRFRQVTLIGNDFDITSYPWLIGEYISQEKLMLKYILTQSLKGLATF